MLTDRELIQQALLKIIALRREYTDDDEYEIEEVLRTRLAQPEPIKEKNMTQETTEAAVQLWNDAGEQLQKADDTLREISSWLGQGGLWNTENLDYDEMLARIKEGMETHIRVQASIIAQREQLKPATGEDLKIYESIAENYKKDDELFRVLHTDAPVTKTTGDNNGN